MPKRIARFLTAACVSILAGIPLSTLVRGETAPVDGCLPGPKGETPPGSHWYYRVDHVNKRNCWYLRREGGEPSPVAQQAIPSIPPPPARPSVADARAELRARPAQQDAPAASPPANAAANQVWGNVPIGNAAASVATRWPEPTTTGSISNARPAAASPVSNMAQPPAAAANEAPPAFPSNLSAAVPPETLPTLIAAVAGALAFAGTTAAFLSKRGRARRLRRRDARYAQGPIWETTDDDRIILSDPSSDSRDYRPRFGRNVKSALSPKFVSRKPKRARR
jgi:hypothetical protein